MTTKFRTRVKRHEAVQWDGERFSSEPQWLVDAMALPEGAVGRVWREENGDVWLDPGFMDMAVDTGDWLVRDDDGHVALYTAEEFETYYEPDEGGE